MSLITCLKKIKLEDEDIQAIASLPGSDLDAVKAYAERINREIDDLASIAEDNGVKVKRIKEENLFVVHNLTAANIRHARKLGAIPVPSLAITSQSFDSFGEISLVGNKELIDPRLSRKNQAFSGDAYSPRYPEVEHKVNNKQWGKFESHIAKSIEVFGVNEIDNIKDELRREGVKALYGSATLMHHYLTHKGKKPKVVYREKTKIDPKYKAFKNMSSVEMLSSDKFADVVREGLHKERSGQALANLVANKAYVMAAAFRETKADRVEMHSTKLALEKSMDEGFLDWVDKEYEKVIQSEKVIHPDTSRALPHNLDNVVKVMSRSVRDSEGFNFGLGSVRATVNKQFKSIAEIQKSRGRITDKMEAIKDEINDEFYTLSEKLKRPDSGNNFGWLDIFSEHLKELAQGYDVSEYGYTESDITEMAEFLTKLGNLPTEYFEAKIQRAVNFNEFKSAIVPQGTDKGTVKFLKDQGLSIGYYKKGDKEDRLKAIQDSEVEFFQDEKRGSITFNGPKTVINLFEGKDLSTALHEFGHFFLETHKVLYNSAKSLNDLPAEFIQDIETIKQWLGVESLDDIGMEQHEQFARGFESYLREGKAPSVELRDVFRRFKSWLVYIYKNARSLNVEVSDEMAGVFDRMLATDAQIEGMRNDPGVKLHPEMAFLLTVAERKDYASRVENDLNLGKEKLLKKALRQLRKEERQWYKEELITARKSFEKEANKEKRFRVSHYLKTGEFLGEDRKGSGPHKLDKNAMTKRYAPEIVKAIPKGLMSTKGVDPDVIAETFGYPDAGVMIAEISTLPARKTYINQLAKKFMSDKHDELANSLEEEAIQAVENSRLEFELNVLARKTGQLTNIAAFRDKAKEIMSAKKVDAAIKANTFYRQEVKAAREAGKALGKKDYINATLWKRRQLLNRYLYSESRALKEEAGKAVKLFKKISKRPAKGKVVIDEDYRQKALELLAAFEFGPRLSETKQESLTATALKEWQDKKIKDDSAEFVQPEEIVSALSKQHYRDLTVSEFTAVTDTVNNIIAQGRLNRTILIEGERIIIADAAQVIADATRKNIKKKTYYEKFGWVAGAKRTTREFFMSLTKARTVIRELDGLEDLGPVYKLMMTPIDNAEHRLIERQKAIGEKVDKLFEAVDKGVRKQKVFIKSINQTLRKEEIIAVALNMGNEGNRDRMANGIQRGKQWNEGIVDDVLSNMTHKDWQFVQSVWDYIDSFWGEIAALEKERNGIVPEKVLNTSFTMKTTDGKTANLKGGYYPLTYDHTQSSEISDPATQDLIENIKVGKISKAQTRRGHTKERGQNMGWPINLSLDVIGRHLNLVAVDLELGPATNNVWKLLNQSEVRSAIDNTMGTEATKSLELWVKDLASYSSYSGAGFEGILNSLRSGLTISTMGLKASTVMVQLGGFTHSYVKLGPKYMALGLAKAFGGLRLSGDWTVLMNKRLLEVYNKSHIMKHRSTTFHRDIYDSMRRLEKGGKIKQGMAKVFFWPIVKMQQMVDFPTWLGAYDQGWDKFGNEKKAVEFADMIVIQSQSSGLMKDLSGFERGTLSDTTRLSVWVKMMTVFMSYFNAKYQLLKESTNRVKGVKDVPRFASDFLMLIIVEAMLTELMLGRGPKEDEDDYINWALKLGMQNSAAMVPGAREVSSALQGFSGSPGGYRGFDSLAQGISAGVDLALDEDINLWRTGRALNSAGGILFKYPSSQINVMLKAHEDEGRLIDYVRRPVN